MSSSSSPAPRGVNLRDEGPVKSAIVHSSVPLVPATSYPSPQSALSIEPPFFSQSRAAILDPSPVVSVSMSRSSSTDSKGKRKPPPVWVPSPDLPPVPATATLRRNVSFNEDVTVFVDEVPDEFSPAPASAEATSSSPEASGSGKMERQQSTPSPERRQREAAASLVPVSPLPKSPKPPRSPSSLSGFPTSSSGDLRRYSLQTISSSTAAAGPDREKDEDGDAGLPRRSLDPPPLSYYSPNSDLQPRQPPARESVGAPIGELLQRPIDLSRQRVREKESWDSEKEKWRALEREKKGKRPVFRPRREDLDLRFLEWRGAAGIFARAVHLIYPILALFHIPATLFLDYNALYMLIQLAIYPISPGMLAARALIFPSYFSGAGWYALLGLYGACTVGWLVLVVYQDAWKGYIKVWEREREVEIEKVYLGASSFNFACMRSYGYFCFLWRLRLAPFLSGGPLNRRGRGVALADGLRETFWWYRQNWLTVFLAIPRGTICASIILMCGYRTTGISFWTTSNQERDATYFLSTGQLNTFGVVLLLINASWVAWKTLLVLISVVGYALLTASYACLGSRREKENPFFAFPSNRRYGWHGGDSSENLVDEKRSPASSVKNESPIHGHGTAANGDVKITFQRSLTQQGVRRFVPRSNWKTRLALRLRIAVYLCTRQAAKTRQIAQRKRQERVMPSPLPIIVEHSRSGRRLGGGLFRRTRSMDNAGVSAMDRPFTELPDSPVTAKHSKQSRSLGSFFTLPVAKRRVWANPVTGGEALEAPLRKQNVSKESISMPLGREEGPPTILGEDGEPVRSIGEPLRTVWTPSREPFDDHEREWPPIPSGYQEEDQEESELPYRSWYETDLDLGMYTPQSPDEPNPSTATSIAGYFDRPMSAAVATPEPLPQINVHPSFMEFPDFHNEMARRSPLGHSTPSSLSPEGSLRGVVISTGDDLVPPKRGGAIRRPRHQRALSAKSLEQAREELINRQLAKRQASAASNAFGISMGGPSAPSSSEDNESRDYEHEPPPGLGRISEDSAESRASLLIRLQHEQRLSVPVSVQGIPESPRESGSSSTDASIARFPDTEATWGADSPDLQSPAAFVSPPSTPLNRRSVASSTATIPSPRVVSWADTPFGQGHLSDSVTSTPLLRTPDQRDSLSRWQKRSGVIGTPNTFGVRDEDEGMAGVTELSWRPVTEPVIEDPESSQSDTTASPVQEKHDK